MSQGESEAVGSGGDETSAVGCPMASAPTLGQKPADVLYYWDYLHLDLLLNSQQPRTAQMGDAKHDEFLFIVVHQTFELWFRQILFELDSVLAIMGQSAIPEREMGTVLSRLLRINEIQRLMLAQIDVLETMTPLDFLEFRSALTPASGFQSVQFRLIENRFGLRADDRVNVEGHRYVATLRPDHAEMVETSEREPSLCDHVERWLARTPFLNGDSFDFVAQYRKTAEEMLEADRAELEMYPEFDEETRSKQLKALDGTVRKFDALFDEAGWDEHFRLGTKRLSHRAFMAALFINLYRDEPILHLPFRVLTALIEIDQSFTQWRQRHALMAHKMLGGRVGTGGRGHAYLEETASRHSVFQDLFDVPTYFVPRSALPPLPVDVLELLDFRYRS